MRIERRALLVAGLVAETVLCLYPPMAFTISVDELSAGRTEHMFLFGDHAMIWRIALGRFVVRRAHRSRHYAGVVTVARRHD